MKSCVFGYSTENLGDDLQSLAVLLHLAHVDALVNRDSLAEAKLNGDHLCIFNAWFKLNSDFRLPAREIFPIFHGFALGNPEMLTSEWKQYLKNNQPIGCRDYWTIRYLENIGISTYWTGCLSLFLSRKLSLRRSPHADKILLVDINRKFEAAYVPREIRRNSVRVSNDVYGPIRYKQLRRWARVFETLKMLSQAKLVVTRRLHIALPCYGFGIPVVVIPDARISTARRRFSGFDQMLKPVYVDEVKSGYPVLWSGSTGRLPNELEDSYSLLIDKLNQKTNVGLTRAPCSNGKIRLNETLPEATRLLLAMPGLAEEVRFNPLEIGSGEINVDAFPGFDKLILDKTVLV